MTSIKNKTYFSFVSKIKMILWLLATSHVIAISYKET